VIRAVEGGLSARAAAGGRGIDGDRLGWSVAADREFGGQITEGAQPLAIGGAYELAIGERLAARGVRAAVSSIWRFYDRHGISIKKTVHAAEQRCPDVASARHHWKSSSRSLTPKSWLSTVLRARFG